MEKSSKWITQAWRRWIKNHLVQYKGGKCEKCGYDKNYLSSYDFHHKNPENKDFGISRMTNIRDIPALKKEVDKCLLLCKNCHHEVHEDVSAVAESISRYDNWLKVGKEKRERKKWTTKRVCINEACRCNFVISSPSQKYCSPKCSSQCQRKVKKRPSPEELVYLMNTMPMVQIGRKYGVSDNAVRKWAKGYGLAFPRRRTDLP